MKTNRYKEKKRMKIDREIDRYTDDKHNGIVR